MVHKIVTSDTVVQEDELLDIVDEHDVVIMTMPRSQAYAENRLASLRAAWLLVRNTQGQFWIPRRQNHKKILPNYLDGSAVGHVSAGESYEQAMIRETQEELNIDVVKLGYRFVGKLTPQDGSPCFVEVFEVHVPDDFVIHYNINDFSEFYWLTSQEILEKFYAGEKMKRTLSIIVQKFYTEESKK